MKINMIPMFDILKSLISILKVPNNWIEIVLERKNIDLFLSKIGAYILYTNYYTKGIFFTR